MSREKENGQIDSSLEEWGRPEIEDTEDTEVVRIPITGTLDLHTFRPGEVRSLVPGYIEACLEEEIYQLRIIHGKGKGVLRQIVHSILSKHPSVVSFGHEEGAGSWGATIVRLRRDHLVATQVRNDG
ncbi:MAG TPA: Smr/MutS family protein [Acidobacteriota bacterium]|nr:Smr/MutS family protein [Acidobacteriota bacterium]